MFVIIFVLHTLSLFMDWNLCIVVYNDIPVHQLGRNFVSKLQFSKNCLHMVAAIAPCSNQIAWFSEKKCGTHNHRGHWGHQL